MGHPWLDKQKEKFEASQKAAAAPDAKKVRVVFREPPDFAAGANIWVQDGLAGADPTVSLLYDYPDFKPAIGWKIDIMGTMYQVASVDGTILGITKL